MSLHLYGEVFILFLFTAFVLSPIIEYLYDPKGLRQYPNQNAVSGITNLGYAYERLRGFRTKALFELHQKHPIIRIRPTSLSFANVSAIKDIYGHSTVCSKGDMYHISAGSHLSLLDVVDKREHARKRKLLSNSFATRNLEGWEHKVAKTTASPIQQFDRACEQASKDEGSQATIDCRKWTNPFTVQAIANIGLSYNTNMLETGDDTIEIEQLNGTEKKLSFIQSLHGGNRATSIVVWPTTWFATLQKLTKIFPPWFRSQWHHGDNYGEIVGHLVRTRMECYKKGEKLDDFFRCLMEDRNGAPHGLEIGEIEAEVGVLMNAGSDTTAIALANLMDYLAKNPSKRATLRAELDTAVPPEEPIAPYARVKRLPYLKACIDEALRIMPPVSFGLARKTPPEGASVLNQWIPGGTTVSVPAYVAHRDPDLFPDPEQYRHERWLRENAKEFQPFFIAFSAGARGCIGRNISYLEQQVLLATLVRRYDFTLTADEWQLEREEAFNLWPGPLPLKISRREEEKSLF